MSNIVLNKSNFVPLFGVDPEIEKRGYLISRDGTVINKHGRVLKTIRKHPKYLKSGKYNPKHEYIAIIFHLSIKYYHYSIHRLVWSSWNRKSIPSDCDIHHVNGKKSDNDLSNLQCLTKEEHKRLRK